LVGLGVRLGADARSQLREIHGPAARRYLLPDVLARLEALSLRGVQDEGHAVVCLVRMIGPTPNLIGLVG
jgi:hypothetical protein